ncbi:putative salicylate hydroxylase [Diaporthe ampelina]|uniref:Putative salicylate hydroxylase n=1 Tax=Diaporthe ampelina TaxID=1214573 RepID=A0A0G2FDV1_9PEZI|nr:putative salicylate hydroxylase [Diaporthe ampelina]
MPMSTDLPTPTLVSNHVDGPVGAVKPGATNGHAQSNGHHSNGTRETPKFTSTSYPSNCLRFLGNPQTESTGKYAAPKEARVKLNILVVGAGLGGLATAIALRRTGHHVTVFEQAPQLMEVGAGIQVPPNSGKLLARWGVMQRLAKQVVEPAKINFRRWENGAVIGVTDLTPEFTSHYEAPYYVVHRAHLHTALYEQAAALGVKTRLNSKVARYDAETATINLTDGTVFQGDLVVAADGVKSTARSIVSPNGRGAPKYTGYAVYRATVEVEKMKAIPEISWVLEQPNLNLWIGEDRHVMTYCITGGQAFNMVLSHPDPTATAAAPSTEKEILATMKKEFEGWHPHLTTIINLVEKTMKTPLMSGEALDSWVSPSSKLLILGDAAHAMLPYMSEGAAMAVEDGAALAVALGRITSPKQVGFALRVFEAERVRRTGMMQEASMVNSMIWHFGDGPLQEARDEAMRPEVEGKHFLSSPNQWSDPVTQEWAYGYDAEKVMDGAWDEAVGDLIAKGGK